LRELRTSRGFSRRALAEKSGLNVNTLSMIENQRTISGQTYTLAYDAEGRLASASGPNYSAAYVYDADGRMVKKTENGTVTLYVTNALEVTNPGDAQNEIKTQQPVIKTVRYCL
jgi:transcriptional regulator with XRE-family HTH domain